MGNKPSERVFVLASLLFVIVFSLILERSLLYASMKYLTGDKNEADSELSTVIPQSNNSEATAEELSSPPCVVHHPLPKDLQGSPNFPSNIPRYPATYFSIPSKPAPS